MVNRRLLQALLAVSLCAGSVTIVSAAAAPVLNGHPAISDHESGTTVHHPKGHIGLSRKAVCGATVCACLAVMAATTAPATATALAATAAYTWLANHSPWVWRSTYDTDLASMQQENTRCRTELEMMRSMAEGFMTADEAEHERDRAEHERLRADAEGAEILHDIEHPGHHHES